MHLAPVKEETTFPSATRIWVPSDEQFIAPDLQPIFKLHGSSNWRTGEASEIMILGGGKARAIKRYEVLRWYVEVLAECLSDPAARLMVIGYSFRDEHINNVLMQAIETGLQIFVVDPAGTDVAATANPLPRTALGYKPTPMQENLQKALVGASRRPLSSTFANDGVEHGKLMRFFDK